MDVEQIKTYIKSRLSSLQGEITDAQAGLIYHLTRDGGFDCQFDDNPIVFVLFGDERVTELSKADAGRVISYFGEKIDGQWQVKNVGQMSLLHREFAKEQGQLELF